jgi:hypothetical protein
MKMILDNRCEIDPVTTRVVEETIGAGSNSRFATGKGITAETSVGSRTGASRRERYELGTQSEDEHAAYSSPAETYKTLKYSEPH